MPRSLAVLAFLAVLAGAHAAPPPKPSPSFRLVFGGDVLLSRQVAVEMRARPGLPLAGLAPFLRGAWFAAANLEGAVGSQSQCISPARLPDGNANLSPCFPVAATALARVRSSGLTAMGVANNHSDDLGATGFAASLRALAANQLHPLDWPGSPAFFRRGSVEIAVVALSTVPARDGSREEIPSPEVAQKLRLARALSNLVVVYVHWGTELHDWTSAAQQAQASWLIAHGADLVIGAHPHVVEQPRCVAGRPVFYSLGNLLFDQRYPETRVGMLADCEVADAKLRCAAERTAPPRDSFYPLDAGRDAEATRTLAACPAPLHAPLGSGTWRLRPGPAPSGLRTLDATDARGAVLWRTRPDDLIAANLVHFAGGAEPYLFTLERHSSPLDGKDAVRPYVYQLGPRGPIARWRGSALAWPLVDAEPLRDSPGILCALHTNGSFLVPKAGGYRFAAYRWDGFGFAGDHDPEIEGRCRALMEGDLR